MGPFHTGEGPPYEALHLVVEAEVQDRSIQFGSEVVANADVHFGLPGPWVGLVPLFWHDAAAQWLTGQGPGKVEALLPAAAIAQVTMKYPTEHTHHFQG